MSSPLNPPSRPAGFAPFALGFRPFFLAAGLFAIVLLGLWLAILQGRIATGPLAPAIWHGHEMLFGFTVAVIAGFLLTAAQNWTGIRTPSGTPLAALFLLWLAGRLGFLVPGLPPGLVALVDLAFLPVLALALAWPIIKAKQLNNAPFPIMLLALAAANAMVHGEALGWTAATASLGLHLAAYVVVMMMVVMSGRVIPSFTDNKLRTHARRWKTIEWLAPVATLGALVAALLVPDSRLTALLAAIAAAVHLIRLAGWYTGKFWSVPLLWILHLGYAWIALGFALLALSAAGVSACGRRFTACLHHRRNRRADPGHDGAGVARPYRTPAGSGAADDAGLRGDQSRGTDPRRAAAVLPRGLCAGHGRCRADVDRGVRPVRRDLHAYPAAPAGRRQAGLTGALSTRQPRAEAAWLT